MANRNSSNPFEKSATQNVMSTLVFRYLPFWPIYIITTVVCLTASYFYVKTTSPIYEANAMILIKDQKSSAAQDNSALFSAFGINGSAKSVANETEVLKSRILLGQVAKQMGLYTQIYVKGKFRDELIYPSPVKFVAAHPELLKNSPPIAISFQHVNDGDYVLLAGKKYILGSPVSTPYGDFTIFRQNVNSKTLPANGKYYLSTYSLKSLVASLYTSLTIVSVTKESALISLKCLDLNGKRAEDVLTNLMSIYNNAGIDDKNATSANTLAFITDRLEIVSKDLSGVEDNLQKFRSKEGIIDLPSEGRLFLENVERKDELMSQLQLQLEILDKVEKYVIQKGKNAGTVPSTLGLSDPILSQLLDKLYTAELELDVQRQRSGENSPGINALLEQIDQLKASLLENIHNLKDNLNTSRQVLQQDLNSKAAILKTVPEKERAFLEISRNQEIKNGIYTYLLQRREEAALNEASAVADSRIINSAQSRSSPVKPVAINIYLIGLFIGFFSGVIFVVIKEQYNQTVLFRSEIDRATDVTILAELIHDMSGETLVIQDGLRTVIAEQLRALRTALNYIGVGKNHKTILLTSSISGEGKSFIGLNLAVSLAITGKKVVILEFDLRKPKISKMLGISQEPGISNYLAGFATYEEISIPLTDKNLPNLFVLPAGVTPPNPTELMLNGRLDSLIDQLKKDFDYILIDSPPIGLVTDAKILNDYTDACMFMVRHKYTPKHYLQLIQHLYLNKELKNMYVIFNGVKARGVMGYGSGGAYGYGQGYGQGYGYGVSNGYTRDAKNQKKGLRGLFKRNSKKVV
jgi:tyrosine-protein kinase Etk/Wzc